MADAICVLLVVFLHVPVVHSSVLLDCTKQLGLILAALYWAHPRPLIWGKHSESAKKSKLSLAFSLLAVGESLEDLEPCPLLYVATATTGTWQRTQWCTCCLQLDGEAHSMRQHGVGCQGARGGGGV